jgi:hypothetical protein
MAQAQTWIRPDSAKLSYAREKQLASGDLGAQEFMVAELPAAASLPSTFTGAYFTPKNGDGTEKVILSGVPFKKNGVWGWLMNDTEQSTEGLMITKAHMLLVQIASVTFATGQRAYIIPTSGLVTNDADGGTNNFIGHFLTENSGKLRFSGGALSSGVFGDTLPDGDYAYINFNGAQAAPGS